MLDHALRWIDWFIPDDIKSDKTELLVWRNFVFTHIAGPILSESIGVYLWRADRSHGFACLSMIAAILGFLALPFVLKYTKSLVIASFLSVQLLCFASLFGAFNYGGVSSPFLPWLLVAVLLGYFYVSDRPRLVTLIVALNIAVFALAYALFGFQELVPTEKLAQVGWISVLAAFVYMAWMANFYAEIMSVRSELERETERHRETSENLRRANEIAERASRGKSSFLARMSHELRTPLNAVIGYSELLIDELDGEADNEVKRSDLLRINNAGKHLLSLVTDVIDVSKIENDSVEVQRERFDVDVLLEQLMETSAALIKVKKNRLVLQRREPLGEMTGDAVKLRQVLLNLIGNAAKFTSNGLITVAVGRRSGRDGAWIDFIVADSGIGISAHDQTRLFENFRQASAETAKLFGGSGLGLSICARLCTLMGGDVSVESELGRGSRFCVSLPAEGLADEPASSAEALVYAPAL
jgi:signal transduction histidine kinase